MDSTWLSRTEKDNTQLFIDQHDIFYGVTFLLAAIMTFLFIFIFGTLDASLGAIMAKRGALLEQGSCVSSEEAPIIPCSSGSKALATIARSRSGSKGEASTPLLSRKRFLPGSLV
jgi:hypothetical protein